MPKLTISLPDHGDVSHDLHDPLITIGRVSDNAIELADISVSSRHAKLTLGEGGDYVLTDIGSTNGTELNGREIAANEEHKLQDGDKIVFGKINAHYASENPAEAREMPEAEAVAAVIAEKSTRPADFANASPFQTKKKKKDPMGVGIMVLSVLAILVFGYAVSLLYAIKAPL